MNFAKSPLIGALLLMFALLGSQPCSASDFRLHKVGAKLTIIHEENIGSPSPGNCPTGLSEPCDLYVLSIPTITSNPSGDGLNDLKKATELSLAFAATCADIIAGKPAFEIDIPREAFATHPHHFVTVEAVVPVAGGGQAYVKGSISLESRGSLSMRGEADFASLKSGGVAFGLVTPIDGDADDPDVSCVTLTPTYRSILF